MIYTGPTNFVNDTYPALNAQNMNAIAVALQQTGYDVEQLKKQSASPFDFKGDVASLSDLPTTGNKINDTYYVQAEKYRVTWTGTQWEQSSMSETDYTDELSAMNDELENFKSTNSVNVLKPWPSGTRTNNGVTCVSDGEGNYVLNGTATKNTFHNIIDPAKPIPASSGDAFYLELGNAAPVAVRFYARDSAGNNLPFPNGLTFYQITTDGWVVMPEGTVSFYARFQIESGSVVNNVRVSPKLLTALSNQALGKAVNNTNQAITTLGEELNAIKKSETGDLLPFPTGTKTTSGVTYTALEDGSVHVISAEGGSTAASSFNLTGSSSSLPKGFEKGKTYYVRYTNPENSWIFVQCRQYKNGAESIIPGTEKRVSFSFKVPDDIDGMVIRLFVASGRNLYNGGAGYTVKAEAFELSPETNPPMLTIIDDDGHTDYMTELLPLFESLNAPVATAITSDRVGTGSYMTWEQVTECYRRGAEVLCHTKTHTPDNTDVSSVEELIKNYTIARNEMFSRGLMGASILVYNNATGTMEMSQTAAEQVFTCGIHSAGRVNNYRESLNPYCLQRYPVDLANTTLSTTPYDLAYMKRIIDSTASVGGWMIWIMHTTGAEWQADKAGAKAALEAAVLYAREKGVPVVTAEYGAKKYLK